MNYMKEFVFYYPTWQIQFVITHPDHQRKGLANILRKYVCNLAHSYRPDRTLIGGIVGLWNTASLKNFGSNGRLPCLDRVLIDRNSEVGYPRAHLS